jgi:putative transposase
MARGKRHSPEQIVNVLRQIEVAIANGKMTPAACKEAGFTEQPYYRWRKEYGGLKVDQAKQLKELEQESSKLKRLGRGTEPGHADSSGHCPGKLLSPERRPTAVAHAQKCGASERHACHLIHQPRGT